MLVKLPSFFAVISCWPSFVPVRRFATSVLHAACVLIFLSLGLCIFPSSGWSAANVTVLYPEVSAPYKTVFDAILQGIEADNGLNLRFYPLQNDYQLALIQQHIKTNKTTGLIALGKRGYRAAKKLNTDMPTVVGALPLVPNGISGVSLSADPDQLFSRLKSLIPDCKKVHVVYSPAASGWLMPLAEAAAEKNQLELISYSAGSLKESVHHYRTLLNSIRGRENAIWLPLDKLTVNDDIILPLLLREAWHKDLAIFSSKPTHVQRGVLFSMYPDNFGLGQELAALMKNQLESNQQPIVNPLKKLLIAVNLRTAAHLGLNFSPQQQEDFQLTFPTR